MQVDLYDPDAIDAWKKGIHMLPIDKNIRAKSDYLRGCAELIIGCLSEGNPINCSNQLISKLNEVNEGGKMMHDWIYELSARYLKEGKKVALLGGDHSTPLGYIKALGEQHESFGILQIDAHADLREAYEGFKYSHASIMYNVLKEIPQVSKLVQVGIRDYCDEELDIIQTEKERIKTFFDKHIKEQLYEEKPGKTSAMKSLPHFHSMFISASISMASIRNSALILAHQFPVVLNWSKSSTSSTK